MARQRGDGGRFHTANNNPGGHKNDNGKLSPLGYSEKNSRSNNKNLFRTPRNPHQSSIVSDPATEFTTSCFSASTGSDPTSSCRPDESRSRGQPTTDSASLFNIKRNIST